MIKQIMINVSSNLSQLMVNIVVTLIMAPIYIKNLGHYDYGLKEIVFLVSGYMGLFCLGIKPTITRYVAMYNATRDKKSIIEIYSTSLAFMTILGIFCCILFFILASFTPYIIDGDSTAKYKYFIILIGLNLLFSFPMSVTEHMLEGLHMYYLKNMVNIISTILIAIACYYIMSPMNALLLLTGLIVVTTAAKMFIFIGILLSSKIGGYMPSRKSFNLEKLKSMITFGSKSFVQGISQMINQASDKIVIGTVLGPSAIPAYTIPSTLLRYINMFAMTSTQVLMPVFSDLNAKNDACRLTKLYLKSSKYVLALVLGMSAGMGALGAPFIDVWMPGEFDFNLIQGIVIVLALYMVFHRLNPFSGHYLLAINKHGLLAKIYPIGALVNLVSSIILIHNFGLIGVAIGTLIPVFFLIPIVLIYTCNNLKIKVMEYIKQSLLPPLYAATPLAIILIYMRFNIQFDNYFKIFCGAGFGIIIFSISFFLFICDKEDLTFWLNQIVKKCKPKLES